LRIAAECRGSPASRPAGINAGCGSSPLPWILPNGCRLDLAQYAEAFAANAIDWSVLPSLTADDLKDIGVAAVGYGRKRLKRLPRSPRQRRRVAAAPPYPCTLKTV
jgi:SAM domain (Sterile alpha motif)